jgi:hypothetical protein
LQCNPVAVQSGCGAAPPAGRLLMIVKSAHVYETERSYLRDVLEGHR